MKASNNVSSSSRPVPNERRRGRPPPGRVTIRVALEHAQAAPPVGLERDLRQLGPRAGLLEQRLVDSAQFLPYLCRALGSPLRLPGHKVAEQVAEPLGKRLASPQRTRLGRLLARPRGDRVRPLPAKHLVEADPQGEEIRSRVHLVGRAELLGRHVLVGADPDYDRCAARATLGCGGFRTVAGRILGSARSGLAPGPALEPRTPCHRRIAPLARARRTLHVPQRSYARRPRIVPTLFLSHRELPRPKLFADLYGAGFDV